MTIKAYAREIEDGLADAIQSSTSIAYQSIAQRHQPSQKEVDKAEFLAKANSNPDQIDLYYLNSVLVSTGWNRNDDVFDYKETWAARNTPEDKPFNYMHDESDILGHITGNCVVSNGKIVKADQEPPTQFDIITSAVLYTGWSDEEKAERISTLISEIEQDKWFVSMECLFAGFDYAVVTPEGGHNIIQRDEASAWLTKHLKAYGGAGEYEGYKVGRLLKNISFSGKGLVSKPANPASIILKKDVNPFKSEASYSIQESSIWENSDMANDNLLEQQVEELKSQLAKAREEAEAAKDEISRQKDEEIKAQVDALEASISEKDEAVKTAATELKTVQETVAALEEKLAAKETELTEALEKIEAHEAEVKTMARKSALISAGLAEDAIDETIEKFAEASDEMFDEIVALFAGQNPTEEEAQADEDVAEETAEETQAEDEDEAEAEADAETLEDVEEEVEAALTDDTEADSVQDTREAASAWLRDKVLKTTASVDEN
jgi:chemotaxis protein histidine kinase CheA